MQLDTVLFTIGNAAFDVTSVFVLSMIAFSLGVGVLHAAIALRPSTAPRYRAFSALYAVALLTPAALMAFGFARDFAAAL